MFPYFTLFNRIIGMYPIMVLIGVFAVGIYVCNICKKNGYDDNIAIIFLLLVSIGVVLGGHILYTIVNYKEIIYLVNNKESLNSLDGILNSFTTIFGGNIFYGGLLGGILAGIIYMKNKPQNFYLADIVTPAIPLFHFFGRIGCFLGGCCFGIKSSFGITFHNSFVEIANGVSRFPVQLLEAIFNIILFFILANFRKRGMFKDRLLYIYLLIYSIGRFFIEFLRGDSYRGFFFIFSTSQIISILIISFILIKLLYKIILKKDQR